MEHDDCNEQFCDMNFIIILENKNFVFMRVCTYVNMYAEDAVMFMK